MTPSSTTRALARHRRVVHALADALLEHADHGPRCAALGLSPEPLDSDLCTCGLARFARIASAVQRGDMSAASRLARPQR